MPTSQITVENLKRAIQALLEYENPTRIIRYTPTQDHRTPPRFGEEFITRNEFSERLADFYPA